MRKYLLPVAGLALMAASNGAFAASANSSFNVLLKVAAACTVTAADLNFGTFTGSIPAATTGSSNATVTCNKNTPYSLSFAATSTGTATATMANGTSTIPANLTISTTSQTATGGADTTTINGTIVSAVASPVVGTYTVAQAIYVLY